MSFKEDTSLYEIVESFLNQDSRLNKNSQQTNTRPDLSAVKKEITKDSSKFNCHANKEDNDFPKANKNAFKFLGLVTDKDTHMLSLKPKPVMLKQHKKCATNITITTTTFDPMHLDGLESALIVLLLRRQLYRLERLCG